MRLSGILVPVALSIGHVLDMRRACWLGISHCILVAFIVYTVGAKIVEKLLSLRTRVQPVSRVMRRGAAAMGPDSARWVVMRFGIPSPGRS